MLNGEDCDITDLCKFTCKSKRGYAINSTFWPRLQLTFMSDCGGLHVGVVGHLTR